MIFQHLVLHTLLFLIVTNVRGDSDLENRCGDCWCIPSNGGTGACPNDNDDTIGITNTFNLTDSILWSTFVLTNADDAPFLTLADDCYPFRDSMEPISGYPGSNQPQCTKPDAVEGSVCGYIFAESQQVCAERSYEIATFDSYEAAEAAGAVVTHEGACGVCSSASDLWARIKNYDNLEGDSVVCGTSYIFGSQATRFDTLVKCFTDMGFSQSCSTLWAHSTATAALSCGGVCQADVTTGLTVLNEPPPSCEYADCLQCSNQFQGDFDAIAGRTLQNSGITERIARPCDEFARIIHDPCVGTTERGEVKTDAPTKAPTNASASSTVMVTLSQAAIVGVGALLFV